MRVLIAAQRPTPPFFFGGVEVNNRLLGRELIGSGHEVVHVGCYTHPRWGDDRLLDGFRERLRSWSYRAAATKVLTAAELHYRAAGAECYMTGRDSFVAAVYELVSRWQPDVVVTTCVGSQQVVEASAAAAVPAVAWVQDVSEDGAETARTHASATVYASQFLRTHHVLCGGHPGSVVYPPFIAPARVTPMPARRRVLMVNPIPEKGGDLLLELARCLPRVEFEVLAGWRDPEWAAGAPQNVKCMPQRDDVSPLYRAASLIVVPSRVAEGFGRVAVEAALFGRRALCHAIGGLPEASGTPENLIESLSVEAWLIAVHAALSDHTATVGATEAANRYAQRFARKVMPELLAALA